MRLALVSPCYNEEETLPSTSARITKLFNELIEKNKISGDSFHLLVNDGSADATWEVIQELHDTNPYYKGVNLTCNVGHQQALMAGMLSAMNYADVVITIDADLQDDLNCIEQMLDAYNEGNEIVYGVKVMREVDPFLKRLSASVFYAMQEKLGVKIINNHADFRLMSKKAISILAQYPERNLYLRALVPMIGLKSTTVDDVIQEREHGHSKYTLVKMLNLAVDGITSFSAKPIYYIIYAGCAMVLMGLLAILADVVYALARQENVAGWASLIISVWIVGGLIMIALGGVGIYIAKIYQEVKGRPLYNIDTFLD